MQLIIFYICVYGVIYISIDNASRRGASVSVTDSSVLSNPADAQNVFLSGTL